MVGIAYRDTVCSRDRLYITADLSRCSKAASSTLEHKSLFAFDIGKRIVIILSPVKEELWRLVYALISR